jgi:hypothetical protein
LPEQPADAAPQGNPEQELEMLPQTGAGSLVPRMTLPLAVFAVVLAAIRLFRRT